MKFGDSPARQWFLLSLPIVLAALIAACASTGSDQSTEADSAEADQADGAAVIESEAASTTMATGEGGESTASGAEASDGRDGDADQTDAEQGAETTEPAEPFDASAPVQYADDFARSIQPIFANRCASCHTSGGPGTAHWELTTVGALAEDHATLAGIVASGFMPPWPAGGSSPAFKEDRSLRDDQLQAILDWSEAGAPIDVPSETKIEALVEVNRLLDPDMVLAPLAPYAGSSQSIDDYRCQVYDPELTTGAWITDYEFLPDQTEVVHHAIGYLLPPSAKAKAEARDGRDGKPGWECYGSSGLGDDGIFLGWAPGQAPSKFPDGTGLWMEPGAFLVIQIHYHYEETAPLDRSTIAINFDYESKLDPISVSQLIAPAEIPCTSEEEGPLCDRDAAVANAIERYGQDGVQADTFLKLCGFNAGDFAHMTNGIATSSCDIPVGFIGAVGEIVTIMGHEHEIGAWFKMTLNPTGPNRKVLLDIPNWRFDWQYNYEPVEPIVLKATDVIRIECGWDRARRDPALEPAYVLWADGTNDEMCFGTIATRPATAG